MQPFPLHARSQLYMVRLWMEPVGHGQEEMRMRVSHVISGETRYFRTWSDLRDYMVAKVTESDLQQRTEGGDTSR